MNASSARPSARRTPVVALSFFLLGAVLTIAWFEYGKNGLPGQNATTLPGDILDQLRQLSTPVQIQFYSVLPPGGVSESVQNFSQRVDGLLTAFQNANAAEIHVSRNVSPAETNADAAATSGLRPFNLEKGEACYLGVSVASGGRTESLPQLQPEWAPALPYDLARAILHVATLPPVPAKAAPLMSGITNEILRLIPNFQTATPAEADRILHDNFLKQCAQAGTEMEAQINAAAQAVVQAQKSGSPAELATARKHLSQVQLEQTEKLQEIGAHLQLQLAAFQQMKAAGANSAK
jgi:ABC-type uncharacterized transport system